MYTLFAALCLIPFASAMFMNHGFPHPFMMDSIDRPDQKIYRKSPTGQIHAYDVSTEVSYAPNGYGGLSAYNLVEVSDPDPVYPGFGGFGMPGMNTAGLTGNTAMGGMRGGNNMGTMSRLNNPVMTSLNSMMPGYNGGMTASGLSPTTTLQMPAMNGYLPGYNHLDFTAFGYSG